MYDRAFAPYQRPSFVEPVRIPDGLYNTLPTFCVEIAESWRPYLLGALLQLAQPSSWIAANDTELYDILGRVQDLLGAVGAAGACMQAGSRAITIPAGSATATVNLVFPGPFTAPPVLVANESTGLYIASALDITATGCTLAITSSVTLRLDGASTVSWIASVRT